MSKTISADFPFQSKYVSVLGSKMHYIDEGEGDPILFLHGAPTSSYLWRNVIPYLTGLGRCIAPDLIGMGKSDKPDIEYGFVNTYKYLDAFITQMGLKNVTLVLHDWGSGLGFHYANLNRENIKAIAFMEAMVSIPVVDEMPTSTKIGMKLMRSSLFGPLMVKVANIMVNKVIPDLVMRDLSDEEMGHYKRPYPTMKSRTPLLVWPREIPINGKPKAVADAILSYRKWLAETDTPMLGFQVTPGVAMIGKDVTWVKENISNVEIIDLGEGLHFIQEDYPHEIGQGIAEWYRRVERNPVTAEMVSFQS